MSLAYPRETKHIPRNLNLPPFCRCLFLWKWCNPFPRARARLKHAHSFDRCGGQRSRFLVLTKRSAASGDENDGSITLPPRQPRVFARLARWQLKIFILERTNTFKNSTTLRIANNDLVISRGRLTLLIP